MGPRCTRSKWSECKANLRSWYTAQQVHRQETGDYSADASKIGFLPERGNRYLYAWRPFGIFTDDRELGGKAGILPDRSREPVPLSAIPVLVTGGLRLGVFGRCPGCAATAACVGQLDDDAQYDVWSISTEERVDLDGRPTCVWWT